jgi:tetratricopeptide (TPR) repeat protein
MAGEHLIPADFDRLVRGTLSPKKKRIVRTHLIRGCPRCSGNLARFGGFDSHEITTDEYDVAVSRASANAVRITAPSRAAFALVASLLADNENAARPERPGTDFATLRGLPRLKALLEASRDSRHGDTEAMLGFAKLAHTAANRLRMRDFGKKAVADLRALAAAELATAYRIRNDLDRAAQAMHQAIHWCRYGSRSDLLLARVADLLVSLLAYQRRFPEAHQLLRLVYRSHVEAGRRHLAARALIQRGNLSAWECSPGKAILLLRRGFDLLDPTLDPQLATQTVWNLVATLVDLGRFRSARHLLFRCRTLFAEVVASHRIRWLEGKVYAGLADTARAETAFKQARAGFSDRGEIYGAAMVGLDLCALWARQGRIHEIHSLSGEIITMFRAMRVAREAIATLLVLQRACLYGGEVTQIIDMTAGLLRDLERQPVKPRYGASSSPPPS